jgi:GH15 family glucan-1,4-alpha-glucosidase
MTAARDDERVDGYAPLRSYAAIGDRGTLALVARDGAIDWLCAPEFDGPSVFAAMLDPGRGGSAALRPSEPFTVERRYLERTNVLETTFTTARGRLRLTDAMVLERGADRGARTILRRVECLAGEVDVAWGVWPRFGYGAHAPQVVPADGGALMSTPGLNVRSVAWELGEPLLDARGVNGDRRMAIGDRGLLALLVAPGDAGDPGRDELERELEGTSRRWREWAQTLAYDGPWKEEVLRSGLALELLVSRTSGAVLAAGTTSLPEVVGGVRNWDYRYSWVRDALLVLDAFFALGREREAEEYFGWLRERLHPTSGEVGVLYDLRGQKCAPERELDLAGWCRSRPVRVGNAASGQFQQSTYGTLLHACQLYAARAHGGLPGDQRRMLLQSAELLARTWSAPDAGIWEERGEHCHHTHSKMMSALGLDCAAGLAREAGGHRGLAERLARAAAAAVAYVESECVDPGTGAYVRAAHGEHLDAAVLMPLGLGYERWAAPDRADRTIDAVRERLGEGGALLYRYRHDDGLPGNEGFFTPCAFWLVAALTRSGRIEEAAEAMDELAGLANDVGLFSEEIARDGAFLGNLPQALTHASLVSAAAAVVRATGLRSVPRAAARS